MPEINTAIESILVDWIKYYINIGLIITNNIIKIKAQKIYEKLKVNDKNFP
jgi:hypothetical protein